MRLPATERDHRPLYQICIWLQNPHSLLALGIVETVAIFVLVFTLLALG